VSRTFLNTGGVDRIFTRPLSQHTDYKGIIFLTDKDGLTPQKPLIEWQPSNNLITTASTIVITLNVAHRAFIFIDARIYILLAVLQTEIRKR
jgi:hypothetical protein